MIVVYDITRRETFEHVEYWMSEIRNNSDPDIGIMLIGNKSDEQARRAVSIEEAKLYAGTACLLCHIPLHPRPHPPKTAPFNCIHQATCNIAVRLYCTHIGNTCTCINLHVYTYI